MSFFQKYLVIFASFFFCMIPLSQAQNLESTIEKPSGPSLSCELQGLLFFYYKQASPFPQNLVCENKGNQSLVLQNLSLTNPQDPFFSFQIPKQKQIAPGQKFTIQVGFKPPSLEAQATYQNEIILKSNDKENPSLHFSLKAEYTKAPFIVLYKNKEGVLAPVTSLDFGTIKWSDSKTETLIVRKIGNFSSSTFAASVDGMDSNAFGIVSSSSLGDQLYVTFQPVKAEERHHRSIGAFFLESFRGHPAYSYTASLHIHYQVELAGKVQTGEIVIDPITGSTKAEEREAYKEPLPRWSPVARYALGIEIGPGFSQFPKEVTQNSFGNLSWTEGQIPFMLTRIKPSFIFIPSRASLSSFSDFELSLEPYLEVGTFAQPGQTRFGIGQDGSATLYLDKQNLIAVSFILGVGYSHLSWSPLNVISAEQNKQSPNLINEFNDRNHFFKISSGFGISVGLDKWAKVKGFDLYVQGIFTWLISLQGQNSGDNGLGAYFPIGVRYNFPYKRK